VGEFKILIVVKRRRGFKNFGEFKGKKLGKLPGGELEMGLSGNKGLY